MHAASARHIPVLDSLRFFAALFVMMSHYTQWVLEELHVNSTMTFLFSDLGAIGMPLFFVLSGVVIHYNYADMLTQTGGIKKFWVARFTRLYPLFLVLFVLEFYGSMIANRSSCGHMGSEHGLFAAAPYHLLFIQSWFYGIICNNNLIYQYHMLSGVTWSLSVELFFYIAYCLGLGKIFSRLSLVRCAIFALTAYMLTLAFLGFIHGHQDQVEETARLAFGPMATVAHGYQDSLLRWLYYFNPLIWLAPFILGMFIAEVYRRKGEAISRAFSSKSQFIISFMVLVAFAVFYYFVRFHLLTNHVFLGRTYCFYLLPMVALVVFVLMMFWQSGVSRALGNRLFVALGQASYSIYLLHAVLGRFPRDAYGWGLDPWVLYTLCILAVLLISRITFVIFERPVQRVLRRWMLRQPTASAS
jgi:peptidoglycan/LPS O-acetylase OafA/YrhL